MFTIILAALFVAQPADGHPDRYVDQLISGEIGLIEFDYGAVRFPVDDPSHQAAWERLAAYNERFSDHVREGGDYLAGGNTAICDSSMLYRGRQAAEAAPDYASFARGHAAARQWYDDWHLGQRLALEVELAENEAGARSDIHRRVHWDQAWRHALSGVMMAPSDDLVVQELSMGIVISGICRVDANNRVFVEQYLAENGWPRISTHGAETDNGLWIMLQHASPDLQATWLPELEQLNSAGDTNPRNYALLYDRVMMHAGQPQRYGSQYTCVDGMYELYDTEDMDSVDARRLAMGMNTVEENGARFQGLQCGN